MLHTTHLRPARTSRLFLVLFLLLPFTFLLAPTLIAQGDGGEPPFTPSEPPALPLLSLAAAPVTINQFPAPTTPLTVTITNLGTGPAQAISLQMDGGLLTLPISQTLGTLEAGQSLTTTLPLELIGYAVGDQSLLLTTEAISLTNPVQTVATLTLLEPTTTNPLAAPGLMGEDGQTEKGQEGTGPEFHLLQVQRPPTTDYRGRVLTFSLHNNPNNPQDLTLALSHWLPGLALSPESLQLHYLPDTPKEGHVEPSLIPFRYDPDNMALTFVPAGDGQYLMTSGHQGESLSGGSPDDPEGWVPTFNAPTTSLFTGSASYQYPLLTPPGPGLFQPSLALSYSGAAGNGMAGRAQNDAFGFGWNLAGTIEVAQSVTFCFFDIHKVCPINVNDNGPGIIELTLSIGGTGYELTHVDGANQNGYPGRYILKGNTSFYVEYCRYTTSEPCSSADNGDHGDNNPNDGAATATTSKGYWVIKDSQNTLYRLGYTPLSEQELIQGGFANGSTMGPWAGNNAPGHALRWRVDKIEDRFDIVSSYSYSETLPSEHTAWSATIYDGYVRAPASYLMKIEYGFNQVLFDYELLGPFYGAPPSYPDPAVISWQTNILGRVEIRSKDYETGSGDYLVRAYTFGHLAQRHGHNYGDPNSGISQQTEWCRGHYTAYWDWRLALLTTITELDSTGQAKVRVNNVNKADVEFAYWWHKTGYWAESGNYARYCAPYLTKLHTAYLPGTPVATFTYNEAANVYHSYNAPAGTTTWLNTLASQTVNGGWTTDAPPQVTNFTYAPNSAHYGGKARTDQWGSYTGAFQGFQEVTRMVMNGGASHLKEVNHFLAYNFDHDWTSLTGSMDWQEVRTPDDKIITRTEEVWQAVSVAIPLTSNPIRYTYLPRRLSTVHYTTYYPSDPTDNLGTRTNYTYDVYNNVVEVREYGTDVGATSAPYRVQETLYAHNTSPTNWLIGLPWRQTVWDGLPNNNDPSKIISRQRTRYDGASCTQVNAQTPTNGLVTATDVYTPGVGDGDCLGGTNGHDFTTTQTQYGQNGDLWWQPTKTRSPVKGTAPNIAYQEHTIHWRNHSTIEKVSNLLGETLYGFNDTRTPWLFTDKTAPNGAKSRYEYDTFGRLIKQYTPDHFTGLATVWSQQIIYKDNAPWGGDSGTDPAMPLYIDTITVPGQPYSATSRTFYDALGRARQQRSWNLASDFDKVVTDTEYNSLGQVICQTTPIVTTWSIFNATLDCMTNDHTTTSYTRSGSPASNRGIDGLTSYTTTLGQTSLSINPAGHFRAQNQDPYGRLASVVEYNIQHNAFATSNGAFNTNPAQWQLQNATATTLGSEQVLQMNGTAWGSYNLLRSSYSLDPTSQEGVSAFFRFRLSNNNHQGRMGLLTNQGGFIGLIFYQGHLYPDYNMNQGDQSHMGVRIPQQANVWYRAQMSVTDQGLVSWRVWQENAPGDPDKQFTWKLDTTASKAFYSTATYKFFSHVGGTVYLGGYQEGPSYVTQYSYDKANNLTQVRDSQGNLTTLTYDKLGRKLSMNDPDMGTWTYGYDLAGNLIRQTDANQQRLCFTYDIHSRLTSKTHNGTGATTCPAAPGGTTLASYGYHSSGMGRGQVSAISGMNNGVSFGDSFSYDYRGRVTSTSRTIAGTAYTQGTTYDLLDRPLALTYPGGEVVTTGYDKQVVNSLTTSNGPTTLVSNVTYNHRLEMTGVVLNNGLTQDYTYSPASGNYRLQSAFTRYTATPNVGIWNRGYQYDPVGNMTQITMGVTGQGPETQTFTYDSLGRLKTAKAVGGPAPYDHTGSNDYDYDAIGNIVSLAGSSAYNYAEWNSNNCDITGRPPLPHAVKKLGGSYYCYDKNGNMTRRVEPSFSGGVTYDQTFDVENRLQTVTVSNNNLTANFAYDASGQRIRSVTGPTATPVPYNIRIVTDYPFPGYQVETHYSWQDPCAPPPSVTGKEEGLGPDPGPCTYRWMVTGAVTRKTYFLGGQAIATHVNGNGYNGFFYLHSDHLGSTSLLTNSSGVKVIGTETRYYPYGSHRLAPTNHLTERDFTGQKENSYIKLIYYNARWYDSQIGRFVSADTIVPQTDNPQAYNRYTYVYNNPLNLVDPSGHCAGNPDEYSNSDRACWILLSELERTWGMDIQDEALWELEHLQQLTMIMHGYSDLVGGDDIWKAVLSESASRAGNDKFLVRGTLPAHCPTAKTGCSKSGEVSFDLNETFRDLRGTAGSTFRNTPSDPTAARTTIAHEYSHILINLLGDEYYSDYMDLRGWHFAPMPNNGGKWLAANHADPIYGWPENPNHHLVQATALYVAGDNTWDMVSLQNRMDNGPIPPNEQIFIEGIGIYLP